MATAATVGFMPEKRLVLAQHEEESVYLSEGSRSSVSRRRRKGVPSGATVVVNAAAGLDGCDDQLLPASFRALEADLNFAPSMLGWVTLAQTLSLSMFSPLWGYASDNFSRKRLLAGGATAWGVITIALAFVSEFWQVILLRFLNGVFLGSVGPVSQSILADQATTSNVGYSFGVVQLSGCSGRLLGAIFTTTFGLATVGGIKGWRICFLCVGIASVLLGAFIMIIYDEQPRRHLLLKGGPMVQRGMTDITPGKSLKKGSDPGHNHSIDHTTEAESPASNHEQDDDSRDEESHGLLVTDGDFDDDNIDTSVHGEGHEADAESDAEVRVGDMLDREQESGGWYGRHEYNVNGSWKEWGAYVLGATWGIKSITVCILEGILGIIPWSAFAFNTLYFQYVGLTDLQAGLTSGLLLIGAAIGGILGGALGDSLHKKSNSYGRPIAGCICMAFRIPLVFLCYKWLPMSPDYLYAYLACAFTLGLSCFGGVAVNRPILASVSIPNIRGSIFAISIAIEGTSAALFGAPLVGYLAERTYSYQTSNLIVQDMPDALRHQNAQALASSLLWLTALPWAIAFFMYAVLLLTFGQDYKDTKLAIKRSKHKARQHLS